MRSIQYPIHLPRDFDMAQIDERVRARGQAFADLEGLAFKAFLTQSAAKGATGNCYAPFYVWSDPDAIDPFLAGPLFGAVMQSFGRPNLLDRHVLEFGVADRSVVPTLATFETRQPGTADGLAAIHDAEKTEQRRASGMPGLLLASSLIDFSSWTVTRVRLWANEASVSAPDNAERFDVLLAVGPALKAAVRR